ARWPICVCALPLQWYSRERGVLYLPTRRSSDLVVGAQDLTELVLGDGRALEQVVDLDAGFVEDGQWVLDDEPCVEIDNLLERTRSEEHTSELQSRFDIVCRLLLAKRNSYNFLTL